MFFISRWCSLHRQGLLAVVAVLLIVGRVAAQTACPTVVEDALDALDQYCGTLERNQACYGNVSLEATPQANAKDFNFEKVGDIVDVTDIESLKLQPMDESTNTWGVVMMKLQADIPDTLPGQNVTFILFGDVEIDNASTDDQTPMQAFTLQTGVGDAGCDEAPESGVMIQTPDGVESVTFNVNGVDMEIGSTVMLQAEPEGDLTVATMEGAAVMQMDGQSYAVICGTEMSIPLDADLRPSGAPPMPVAIKAARMGQMMPSRAFPRPINAVEPISDAKMTLMQERLNQGLPPCGVGSLPACEHALRPMGTRSWADGEAFGPARPEAIGGEGGILPIGTHTPGENLPQILTPDAVMTPGSGGTGPLRPNQNADAAATPAITLPGGGPRKP